ncbi:MAG: hypothetical protein IPO63_03815 [Bacteroidetes bacterium]|nr:hypothetical protein [Bacteroidota bacterium]
MIKLMERKKIKKPSKPNPPIIAPPHNRQPQTPSTINNLNRERRAQGKGPLIAQKTLPPPPPPEYKNPQNKKMFLVNREMEKKCVKYNPPV